MYWDWSLVLRAFRRSGVSCVCCVQSFKFSGICYGNDQLIGVFIFWVSANLRVRAFRCPALRRFLSFAIRVLRLRSLSSLSKLPLTGPPRSLIRTPVHSLASRRRPPPLSKRLRSVTDQGVVTGTVLPTSLSVKGFQLTFVPFVQLSAKFVNAAPNTAQL